MNSLKNHGLAKSKVRSNTERENIFSELLAGIFCNRKKSFPVRNLFTDQYIFSGLTDEIQIIPAQVSKVFKLILTVKQLSLRPGGAGKMV